MGPSCEYVFTIRRLVVFPPAPWPGLADETAWRGDVDRCLGEMERVLVDGGSIIILESQGTASEQARRRGSHLYEHLRSRGFAESCIRTDYRFSRKDAVRAGRCQPRYRVPTAAGVTAPFCVGLAASARQGDDIVARVHMRGAWGFLFIGRWHCRQGCIWGVHGVSFSLVPDASCIQCAHASSKRCRTF